MKKELHPAVNDVVIRCACGNSFNTISTAEELSIDICSKCHPFFTGQQKFVDTAGRIEKFSKRYATKK
jgi:large subunit ribosomal protein L31